MKLKTTLILAAALAAATPMAHAIALSTPGASVTLGDLTFSDFDINGAFDETGAFANATFVDGTYYLSFNGPWSSGLAGNKDFTISYKVTSSGAPINMIDQSFTLTSVGTGGSVTIGESVRKDGFGGTEVAHSSVGFIFPINDSEDPDAEPLTGDNLYVNPAQGTLYVTKDVHLHAAADGVVEATEIKQSFHVPDGGATAVLLGIGILGLGALRRREA